MALTRSYTQSIYFTKNDLKKRKRKAKKTIANIVKNNPAYKEVIQEKLRQVAYAASKKQSSNTKRPAYKKGMGIEFYKTREWLELRYKAIVKHGKTCQCCGSKKTPIHVDHIKPRSKFPDLELDINNLQILCEDCNIGKSNKDVTDWR